MNDFKLILLAPRPAMSVAWRTHFNGLPGVDMVAGTFEELPAFDCMVSAANSFGLMDGGVDAAISRYFGSSLVARVQQRILTEFLGEQPVGTSMIVETCDLLHPFVAHTPTMRVPMQIAHTDNVYLAMWAMLRAVKQHNQRHERRIQILACPGLGTGTGGVPFAEASRQMALAYHNFLNPPAHLDWLYAERRQDAVRYGGDDGYLIPPEQDP